MNASARQSKTGKRTPIPKLSKAQKALAKKHGTPAEFAAAVYQAVPGDISMDEAAAVSKYNREWTLASQTAGSLHRDCSALREKLEVLAYRNRGGIYRKHPTEREIESAAINGISLLRHLDQQIERIAKAHND